MALLLNILFALLAFFGVRWLAGEIGIPHPIGVILAAIVAIVVFFAGAGDSVL